MCQAIAPEGTQASGGAQDRSLAGRWPSAPGEGRWAVDGCSSHCSPQWSENEGQLSTLRGIGAQEVEGRGGGWSWAPLGGPGG